MKTLNSQRHLENLANALRSRRGTEGRTMEIRLSLKALFQVAPDTVVHWAVAATMATTGREREQYLKMAHRECPRAS